MNIRTFVFVVIFFIITDIFAQDGYTVKKDSLLSTILKQNRKLSIFLPDGYDANDAKFPVIYVLDADGRCQHIVPTARFLFLNNKMPKAIIVGVFNLDRNHDFLPASGDKTPMGGGADSFLQFFKKELIPYIDQKYKTESFRVLTGHSFGGVFAMHAFLNDPEVFDSYIAIDPSFWYDNKQMVKNAGNEFLKTKNWKKSLFITGREGRGMTDMGIVSMDSMFKSSAPEGLDWKVVAYQNEDHGSVTFKSVYDGLRFIFDIGGNFTVFPQAGIIPKGSSTYAFINNKNPNLRYTLDGTEPTINSQLCQDTIKIDKPCILKVKTVSAKYNKLATVTRIFSDGEFINGQQSIKNLKHGLKYSYFEGVWDSIPDFSKLTPKKTGLVDSLDLKIALKKDSFALQFEGYLQIKEKALYNLWITSDDGAKFFLNNKILLDNDGLHDANKPVVNLVPLNPGYYPIRLDYFEKTGDQVIMLGYLVGNKKPIPVSKEMLFYKER